MKLLERFPSPLAEEEMKSHGKRVMEFWDAHDCPFDAIYATKRFDILGWWMDEKHGGKWKLLQSLAVVHLGQPYTNAAVERVFSRSTWVDAARAQQVLDCTFEMRVLDAYNRDLVEMAKPLLDEKKAFQESSMAVEEVVNRFAIPSEDDGKEEDKDSETATKCSGSATPTRKIETPRTGFDFSSWGCRTTIQVSLRVQILNAKVWVLSRLVCALVDLLLYSMTMTKYLLLQLREHRAMQMKVKVKVKVRS